MVKAFAQNLGPEAPSRSPQLLIQLSFLLTGVFLGQFNVKL